MSEISRSGDNKPEHIDTKLLRVETLRALMGGKDAKTLTLVDDELGHLEVKLTREGSNYGMVCADPYVQCEFILDELGNVLDSTETREGGMPEFLGKAFVLNPGMVIDEILMAIGHCEDKKLGIEPEEEFPEDYIAPPTWLQDL